MKKRIIASVLCIVMIITLLPAQAVAASFANTTEGKKEAHKAEVSSSIELVRQTVIDYLDSTMAYFSSPDYYSADIWALAQKLYKNETERVSKLTSLAEIVDLEAPSFFGYTPNATTLKVGDMLLCLADLDLSRYKTKEDISSLKEELREQWVSNLSDYKRSNFNDFYWDRLNMAKSELYGQIGAIETIEDYAECVIYWSGTEIFEGGYSDNDDGDFNTDIETLCYRYLVSKDEMEDAIYALEDTLLDYIENYLPKKNYNGNTDNLYNMVDKFEENAYKADYVRQILDYADNTYDKMIKATGLDPDADADKPLANNSDMVRLFDKLEKYFFANYSRKDYSEDGWDSLDQIRSKYQTKIFEAEYKEDLKASAIYNDFVKELKAVKTYADELKESKSDCISSLKYEYLGNKKYNQNKVKPIITEAIKKINAAKKLEQVSTYYAVYTKKANATINKYKIVTSKSGAGAVSASKTVNYGSSYTVKIVPKAGYKIKAIAVDGKKIKLVNSYTFKAVKKSHTIKVTFGK